MKIGLVNLCKTEDFASHKSYKDSIDYLNEENINYIDFASGVHTISKMVKNFHKAIDSDVDLIWFVRGGLSCIETLNLINWDKVAKSGKDFLGLSDFTHFANRAVSEGLTCFYGQGLTNIKKYFPTKKDRKFITKLLKTGKPQSEKAKPLFKAEKALKVNDQSIVGGHLLLFSFMQSQLDISLNNSFVFIEYHNKPIGEDLDLLGYYLNQLLFLLKNNMPKGFILGRTELKDLDNNPISIEKINQYCVKKLKKYGLPIYYLNHYKNTITLSLDNTA